MLKLKSVDSSSENCKYDVFFSFRGEDTQNFSDHFCTALLNEGLITLRDDKQIEREDNTKSELKEGIQE